MSLKSAILYLQAFKSTKLSRKIHFRSEIKHKSTQTQSCPAEFPPLCLTNCSSSSFSPVAPLTMGQLQLTNESLKTAVNSDIQTATPTTDTTRCFQSCQQQNEYTWSRADKAFPAAQIDLEVYFWGSLCGNSKRMHTHTHTLWTCTQGLKKIWIVLEQAKRECWRGAERLELFVMSFQLYVMHSVQFRESIILDEGRLGE